MFNSPCLMYHCWKDAEREARRNPNNGNGGGGGCLLVIAVVFMICLWQAAFQVGGWAVIIALAMTVGLLQGIFDNK